MRTKIPGSPAVDPVVAASISNLFDRPAYVNVEERSVFRYESPSPNPANLAKALALPTDVFWPSPRPDAKGIWKARVMSARDIAADPLLAQVQRHLPRERRLWVAIWPDETVAMTALPRVLKGVRIWWLAMMHDAAQCAPQLAEITERRESAYARNHEHKAEMI
jgi:hypothetical protein